MLKIFKIKVFEKMRNMEAGKVSNLYLWIHGFQWCVLWFRNLKSSVSPILLQNMQMNCTRSCNSEMHMHFFLLIQKNKCTFLPKLMILFLLPAVAIWACLPRTQRGQPIVLGVDPKGKKLLYVHGNSVIIRDIEVSTTK